MNGQPMATPMSPGDAHRTAAFVHALPARMAGGARELALRALRLWPLWLLLAAAGWAASYMLAFNWTDSMPQRLVWLEHGAAPSRGDTIVLRADPPGPQAAHLRGTRWLKIVRGMPGDRITVVGREVFINGSSVGVAAERSPRGTVLTPIEPGVIPVGHLYVAGASADSFDSRYAMVGLIRDGQVLARAHTIF